MNTRYQPITLGTLVRFAAYALFQGFAALLIATAHGLEWIGEWITRSSERLR